MRKVEGSSLEASSSAVSSVVEVSFVVFVGALAGVEVPLAT